LIEAGLAPAALAEAHLLLARLLVTLRLVSPLSAEPPPASRAVVARACGTDGWEELLAAYAGARQTVGELWGEIVKAARC
jgi:glutamate-ammonia-ligase adenylyltransferase